MKTCATCRHFQFKFSGTHAWGQCLRPEVLTQEVIKINVGHLDCPAMIQNEVKEYGRIYWREDVFGCIFHEDAE